MPNGDLILRKQTPPPWWEIEDLIYPGYTYICIAKESPYYLSLGLTCKIDREVGPDIQTNEDGTCYFALVTLSQGCWNRDPPVRTYQGLSIYTMASTEWWNTADAAAPSAEASAAAASAAPLPAASATGTHPSEDMHATVLERSTRSDSKYFKMFEFYNDITPSYIPDIVFEKLVRQRQLGFHTVPMAGGNLITARRSSYSPHGFEHESHPVFIVGKSVVLAFAEEITDSQIQLAHNLNPSLFTGYKLDIIGKRHFYAEEQQWVLAIKCLAAKVLIRHFLLGSGELGRQEDKLTAPSDLSKAHFKLKKVIFINQWPYHIDFQMLYIGFGIVLIHDFAETLIFLNLLRIHRALRPRRLKFVTANSGMNQREVEDVEKLYDRAIAHFQKKVSALIPIYQPIVESVVSTLTRAGIKCLRSAGMLIPRAIEFGKIIPESGSYADLINRLAFNFMNGVAVSPIYSGASRREIIFQVLVTGPMEKNLFFDNMKDYISKKAKKEFEREYPGMTCTLNIHPVYSVDPEEGVGASMVEPPQLASHPETILSPVLPLPPKSADASLPASVPTSPHASATFPTSAVSDSGRENPMLSRQSSGPQSPQQSVLELCGGLRCQLMLTNLEYVRYLLPVFSEYKGNYLDMDSKHPWYFPVPSTKPNEFIVQCEGERRVIQLHPSSTASSSGSGSSSNARGVSPGRRLRRGVRPDIIAPDAPRRRCRRGVMPSSLTKAVSGISDDAV